MKWRVPCPRHPPWGPYPSRGRAPRTGMVPPFDVLLVPAPLLAALTAQATAELPNECCGLLAGRIVGREGRVEARHPLANAAASPVEFLSEPRSMFEADRAMRKHGHDIL